MGCEGQIFSGVRWSLLAKGMTALRVRVQETPEADFADPATNRAIHLATCRVLDEMLGLLEPFVKETEHFPHIADTHRGPVGT